jgi:hypothetical protein
MRIAIDRGFVLVMKEMKLARSSAQVCGPHGISFRG